MRCDSINNNSIKSSDFGLVDSRGLVVDCQCAIINLRPTISHKPQGFIFSAQEGGDCPSSTKDTLVVSEIVGRKAAVVPFLCFLGTAAGNNDYDLRQTLQNLRHNLFASNGLPVFSIGRNHGLCLDGVFCIPGICSSVRPTEQKRRRNRNAAFGQKTRTNRTIKRPAQFRPVSSARFKIKTGTAEENNKTKL